VGLHSSQSNTHIRGVTFRVVSYSRHVNLYLAQDPEADELLSNNPFALLVGMVLDQQFPLEVAFRGPKKIADRMAAGDLQRVVHGQQ